MSEPFSKRQRPRTHKTHSRAPSLLARSSQIGQRTYVRNEPKVIGCGVRRLQYTLDHVFHPVARFFPLFFAVKHGQGAAAKSSPPPHFPSSSPSFFVLAVAVAGYLSMSRTDHHPYIHTYINRPFWAWRLHARRQGLGVVVLLVALRFCCVSSGAS